MKVIIDNYTYEAELAPNATAETFARFLPLELEMSDLNNNEKYFYTAARIPRTEYLPGHIDCGDIMLWEADCIVVFYKSFDNPFPYSRIGRILDADKLPELLAGRKSVRIKFEI